MTQFVIHVGPHKTGTTYLQEAFAHLRPYLAERGVHYPALWGGVAHYQLYDELATIPNPALEAQFARLRTAGHPTVLISAEALSVLPPPSAAYLRQLIGPDTPVRLVFYTRPWIDLLPSQWKQAIKGGYTQTLPEFLFDRLVAPAEHHYVNFGFKLRVLVKAFGKDALRIIAYDQVKAAKRDLFSHFADAILGLPDLPAPKIPPANVSPDADEIEVIRALAVLERAHRRGPIPQRLVDAMVARYLRQKATLETPALRRAQAAHAATLTIDETSGALAALHRQLFAEYGACLVPPRLAEQFFRPRASDIAYVHPDYLLTADVQRELAELHRRLCTEPEDPTRAGHLAPLPAAPPAPLGTPPAAPVAALDPAMRLHLLGYAAADAAAAPVEAVTFLAGGNSDAVTGSGWSVAERTGRWSAAHSCDLRLPRPVMPGDYVLTIQARPFVVAGRLAEQRVTLEANGIACGEVALAAASVVRATLPWEVVGRAETLLLRCGFADAARPADLVAGSRDQRLLGLSFERLSLAGPLPPGAADPTAAAAPANAVDGLMLRFESLGENCEFGLVQRRCGVEPLGLLRFSSTPLAPLLKALRMRFQGLGAPGSLQVQPGDGNREYMVHDHGFGFHYHAWVNVGDRSPEEVLEREHRRLPFLIRKLVEDLTEGHKIFVYRSMSPLGTAQAQALLAAIRDYGPGRLLWLELADAGHPPGSVVEVAPGLLKGHMDRFAPGDNAHDLSLDCWREVCRNAAAVYA